jgi:uncharacterized protein
MESDSIIVYYTMIKRIAENELRRLAEEFRAVAVTGPRQSGKTTLVRSVFPEKPYANLENPDIRRFAVEDPRGFLGSFPDGAILDEVQRAPELFSYLQQVLDESAQRGKFILTGSNHFLLQVNISQSLAGRLGYLFLLPLSLEEIDFSDSNKLLFKGAYPELYQNPMDPRRFYANYIRTYVERDVRMMKNISDIYAFERLLRLCAGRVGQLLNMSSLAVEVGVDIKTISAWLALLESSFILFRLQPHHKNFNKRLVKMPKLYFYDTGLAAALMGIESSEQIQFHAMRGALFENLVILEFLKKRWNRGESKNLYFWRNNAGQEVDLLLENGEILLPIEIKSGKTITDDYFKGLLYWQKLAQTESGYVIYDGELQQKRSNGISVLPLKQMHRETFFNKP